MPAGFFVTFEGLDGSGKSTQLLRLKEWLELKGKQVTSTRQPGGTRIGDRIRGLLLDSHTEDVDPLTELGLMFSDRAQSIAEIIRPALRCGHIVLCDRFTDSTEAYQGGGRRLGSRIVLELHASLCDGLMPDLTILLLPDSRLSLDRARRRNEGAIGHDENRFEKEDQAFYRRVLDKYCEIAARESSRVVTFASNGSIEEIHRSIVQVVEDRLSGDREAGVMPSIPPTSPRKERG